MNQESKPPRRQEQQHDARGRVLKGNHQPNSRVGLSPTEFLTLLPEPFGLSNRSLGSYARQLDLRRQRLKRLEARAAAKGFVVAPERVHAPNLAKLQSLERELETFPTRRRLLKRNEFRIYADALRRTRRAIVGLIRKVQDSEHRGRQERYLARVGRRFLDAPDDVLESFIIGRRNQSGKNLHASALARIRAANLQPCQLSEWGRRGAQVRLEKLRARINGESVQSEPGRSGFSGTNEPIDFGPRGI